MANEELEEERTVEEEKAAAVQTEMEEAVEMAMVAATLEQKVADWD